MPRASTERPPRHGATVPGRGRPGRAIPAGGRDVAPLGGVGQDVTGRAHGAPQTVYFFTARSPAGRLAFETVSSLYGQHRWLLFTVERDEDRAAFAAGSHAPEVIVSFLNPYIVPSAMLDQARGRAFNMHPASRDFPGRDPQHFAFYGGATTVGATLHRMEPAVDSGEILDSVEQPFDRSEGVMGMIARSEALSLAVLLKDLPAMLDGSIRPLGRWRWREEARRTRGDFLAMCRIEAGMSHEEVERRIAAFFNPAYQSVHTEIQGHRFIYDPAYQAGPTALGGVHGRAQVVG